MNQENPNPLSSARRVVRGLRALLGGLVIVGIGISEAVTGWIASGTGTRIFYLIACGLIGGLFVVAGFTELFGKQGASASGAETDGSNSAN
jgi:hypothetical protein